MKNSIRIMKLFMVMVLMLLPMTAEARTSTVEKGYVGPVDIMSIQKYAEGDGWSWDPEKKELVLSGVNMDGFIPYSYTENPDYDPKAGRGFPSTIFNLPGGSTVIVKEGTVNNLRSGFSGDCFRVVSGFYKPGYDAGITIKGGGTLNLERSEIAIYCDGPINIENVNIKFFAMDTAMLAWYTKVKEKGTDEIKWVDPTINITDSNIVLEDCYGGIYTRANYTESGITEDSGKTSGTVTIKNSSLDMQVVNDPSRVRMHNCFIVRNGYLNIENSDIKMDAEREAVVVWKQYAQDQKEEQLIRLTNTKIEGDVEIGVANVAIGNSNVRAETFVKKGEKTEFDFWKGDSKNGMDMYSGYHFSNGVMKPQLSAMIKKCVITFLSEDGKVYQTKKIYENNIIGELPVLKNDKAKENIFLGWSTKKNSETVDVTAKTVVKGDMTLYPVWKKPETGNHSGNTANNNTNNATSVQGLTQQQAEQIITSANTDKKDIAGSEYRKLMLKATGKKKAIQLKWKKVSGASEYVIYGSICGKKMQKLQTVDGSKKGCAIKGLKAGKYYKYMVVAYKQVGTNKEVITASKSAHATTLGGKNGNPTKITGTKKSVTIKVKKTSKIKASIKKTKKVKTHIAKLRYESSNPSIATVSSKGVIKGKKKGNCVVYVYAQNGVSAKIKVKVK